MHTYPYNNDMWPHHNRRIRKLASSELFAAREKHYRSDFYLTETENRDKFMWSNVKTIWIWILSGYESYDPDISGHMSMGHCVRKST